MTQAQKDAKKLSSSGLKKGVENNLDYKK